MRRIIGVGETVLDIIFRDDQPVKAVPGGSSFNAIISIGRTGTPCIMATEVGDDHVGDIVTNFLKDNNVDTSYVFRSKGTQSHISLAFLDNNNDAQYQFYKNHAVLTMHKKMPDVNKGDVVLFGSYFAVNPNLREYVSTFLKKAKERGAILFYDLNFRASHIKRPARNNRIHTGKHETGKHCTWLSRGFHESLQLKRRELHIQRAYSTILPMLHLYRCSKPNTTENTQHSSIIPNKKHQDH